MRHSLAIILILTLVSCGKKNPSEMRVCAPHESAMALWEGVDWTDSLTVVSEDSLARRLANFGVLLTYMDADEGALAADSLAALASTSDLALESMANMAARYFYHPEAPQYDPDLYALLARSFSERPTAPWHLKERLTHHLEQISRNRPGTRATDFTYLPVQGRGGTLSDFAPYAQLKILVFYDPGCEVCHAAFGILQSSPQFTAAQEEGTVAVLLVDPFGGTTTPDCPSPLWTIGYSPGGAIDNDETYVIRATPAIYVLAADNTILEKDISPERLQQIVEGE